MSDDPKRLSDDPDVDDPGLAAQLRSDLRIAKDAPPGYDVEGGLGRLSAVIAGGGHGGGSGPGAKGAGPGAGSGGLASGVKLGLAGLVALCALGGAILAGSGAEVSSTASVATTIPLSAPAPSSDPPTEEPPPQAPIAVEPPAAAPIAAAHPASSASAVATAGPTVKPEMAQMALVRKALASDPARALALAEEGHARFPHGVFWQEREAIAIGALMKLGRTGEAKARARVFVERHPESPYAEALRKLSEGD